VACDFFKSLQVDLGIDREQAAHDKFLEAEEICRNTNLRFLGYRAGAAEDFEIRSIRAVRRQVHKLIGDISLSEVRERGFFGGLGPGATLSNSRRKSSFINKLLACPTVTNRCAQLVRALSKDGNDYEALNRTLYLGDRPPQVVKASRWTTVPKNWKTERSIAIEPLVNAFVQRALGKILVKRLRRGGGVELRKRPALHEIMAERASRDRSLATIDLSMASDTVAYEVVKTILPRSWFTMCDLARTEVMDVYGESHVLQKFSSMGNGFTFELETVIFSALCRVAIRRCGCEMNYSVFGDDIIVPVAAVDELFKLLDLFGFVPNETKSHWRTDSAFRESCGADYFDGFPVKGFKFEELPSCPSEWITLANKVYRLLPEIPTLRAFHNYVVRQLPRYVRRCKGPVELGDIVIHSPREYWTLNKSKYLESGGILHVLTWQPVQRPRVTHAFSNEKMADAALFTSIYTFGHSWETMTSGYKCRWTQIPH
jgi:hypothetical protein